MKCEKIRSSERLRNLAPDPFQSHQNLTYCTYLITISHYRWNELVKKIIILTGNATREKVYSSSMVERLSLGQITWHEICISLKKLPKLNEKSLLLICKFKIVQKQKKKWEGWVQICLVWKPKRVHTCLHAWLDENYVGTSNMRTS